MIYLFWPEFMASKTAWLGSFFIVSSLWTLDTLWRACKNFIHKPEYHSIEEAYEERHIDQDLVDESFQ